LFALPVLKRADGKFILKQRPLIYSEKPSKSVFSGNLFRTFKPGMTEEEKRKALDEVEKQQTQFGEKF